MPDFKGEKLVKDLRSKQIFHYVDEGLGIDVKSREVFKQSDEVIHYPFDSRSESGEAKYTNIKKIRFIGLDGKIPVGLAKSPVKGYGFTRALSRLAYHLDETYSLNEIIIQKNAATTLDVRAKRLTLSLSSLSQLHTSFKSTLDRHTTEIKALITENLYRLFKDQCPKPTKVYIKGTVASSLAAWDNSMEQFSSDDKNAILELFEKLSIMPDFLSSAEIIKTKTLVDSKYIRNALIQYSALMAQTRVTPSLEKKWQRFLKSNSWIFSTLFAQPVILHKDEAYVGGKNIENADGKLSDFLLKNSLSDNVVFLEIKTHKTGLLERKPYRGSNVFSMTKELSGCMAQVLNQRDSFQKEFFSLRYKSNSNLETLNSKCVVLIGTLADLRTEQKESFELTRNNCKDVDIITFDELHTKIEALQQLMKK